MGWMEFVLAMTGILVGAMIFVVPVVSFALRRTLQPLFESWAKTKQEPQDVQALPRAELREEALEERIADIERVLERVVEETEFLRALRDPAKEEPARPSISDG